MFDHQPLADALLAMVTSQPEGISEYALIKMLDEREVFTGLTGSADRVLFQKHFLVMHSLYLAQADLWQQKGQYLSITPQCIIVRDAPFLQTLSHLDASADTLREYYLDSENLHLSEDGVKGLLNDFWQRFAKHELRAHENEQQYLDILGVESHYSLASIKAAYRQKAALYHPDKSAGDSDAFIRVRRAYEFFKEKYR